MIHITYNNIYNQVLFDLTSNMKEQQNTWQWLVRDLTVTRREEVMLSEQYLYWMCEHLLSRVLTHYMLKVCDHILSTVWSWPGGLWACRQWPTQ